MPTQPLFVFRSAPRDLFGCLLELGWELNWCDGRWIADNGTHGFHVHESLSEVVRRAVSA